MNRLSVSEFKAKALAIVAQVADTGEPVVVTKRGKPIAKVIPFYVEAEPPQPGRMQGSVLQEDDIVSPLGAEMWNANG